MDADNAQAATDVDNREAVLCLRCDLLDCDETNRHCALHNLQYGAQIKYARTPKGRAANRKGAAAFYERNKEKVRAQQALYRKRKRHIKIDC